MPRLGRFSQNWSHIYTQLLGHITYCAMSGCRNEGGRKVRGLKSCHDGKVSFSNYLTFCTPWLSLWPTHKDGCKFRLYAHHVFMTEWDPKLERMSDYNYCKMQHKSQARTLVVTSSKYICRNPHSIVPSPVCIPPTPNHPSWTIGSTRPATVTTHSASQVAAFQPCLICTKHCPGLIKSHVSKSCIMWRC